MQQITGLYHPLITLHITVTEQPKIKVASSSLSSLLDPIPLPTHPPGGDERAQKKKQWKNVCFRGLKFTETLKVSYFLHS